MMIEVNIEDEKKSQNSRMNKPKNERMSERQRNELAFVIIWKGRQTN